MSQLVAALPLVEPVCRTRVLVVDDDPMVMQFAADILRRDHDVVGADSGRSALACLEKEDFNAVLTDVTMPGMSGLELYECVRRISAEAAEHMIFMTGAPDLPDVQAFLAKVPNRLVAKPFGVAQLREIVAVALRAGWHRPVQGPTDAMR